MKAFVGLLLLLHSLLCLAETTTMERGYQAYEQGDVTTAIYLWTKMALEGDPTAQLNLGQLYRIGEDIKRNDRQAIKWYSMAAQQGSETAQYNLLLMQKEGRATEQDLAEAFVGQGTEAPTTVEVPQPAQSWLSGLPSDHYLIQIIASSNREAVVKHITKHMQNVSPSAQVVNGKNKGENWYLALMGPFPSKDSAKVAMKKLPQTIQDSGTWVRTVASVQATIPAPR